MSFGSVFHKVVNGVHHLFVAGSHAVEQVTVYIDARPGLKADLNKLLGPVKDAIQAAVVAKLDEAKQASPADAVRLVKADVPDILKTVKDSFIAQAHHAGNLDLIISLAANTVLAAVEPPK